MAAALGTSLKQLSLSSDETAQVFNLLESDKFADALKLSESARDVPVLYVAYAQYRLGHEEQCLETLGDASDRASLHLKAQALYRLERVTIADLTPLKTGSTVENESTDIEVNEMAIAAQHAALSKTEETIEPSATLGSHELLFNKSILLMFEGKMDEARSCLHKAIEALQSLGLDSADYETEASPIYAQMAHLTGDERHNTTARTQHTDSSTRFLTGINFLIDTNPYALHKAYNQQSRLKPSARLFSFQDRFVAFDQIVVLHLIGLSIKKAVKRYKTRYSHADPERCWALTTLLHAKSSKQSLAARIKEDPSDVDAAMALIAKTVQGKQGISKAISIIEALPASIRNSSPGLIGVWAALSDLTPSSQSAKIIAEALEGATSESKEDLLAGSIQASIAKSKDGIDASTRTKIQELMAINPHNMIAQSAQSLISPNDSEILPLPDLSSVNVVTLELGLKRALDTETPVKSVKRTKKSPAQGDGAVDPERWLPKRDRSNYKPSKKDKLKSGGGHQGGMVDESLSSQLPAQAAKTGEVQRKKKNKKGKK